MPISHTVNKYYRKCYKMRRKTAKQLCSLNWVPHDQVVRKEVGGRDMLVYQTIYTER